MVDTAVEKTGGNFAIKLHWGESLSQSKENVDGIKIGAFQIALTSANFHPGKVPTWEMVSLPFLPIQDLTAQARVLTNYYQHPAVVADGARWNAKVILPNLLPAYEIMGTGTAPKTVGDLKGRRIRALGQMTTALAKVGAVPTSMPSPELYGAMERGLLDAVSLDPTNFKAYRIHEIGKWYTTNLALGTAHGAFIVGLDAYNKLPPQYRKLIDDGARDGLPKQIAQYEIEIKDAIEIYNKGNLVAVTFSREDLAKFQEVARPIWDEFAADLEKKGYPGKQLLEWFLAEAKKAAA
jgi:TRAP-type C4-dicarboxylate transport system substrate-binding protein